MPPEPKRRSRFFLGFFFGLLAGAVAVVVAPSWWQSLVPDSLFPRGSMESVVLGKSQEDGRLLSEGSISLQAESHPVEFRKVELRNLVDCPRD